jgi:hypothetical protein
LGRFTTSQPGDVPGSGVSPALRRKAQVRPKTKTRRSHSVAVDRSRSCGHGDPRRSDDSTANRRGIAEAFASLQTGKQNCLIRASTKRPSRRLNRRESRRPWLLRII